MVPTDGTPSGLGIIGWDNYEFIVTAEVPGIPKEGLEVTMTEDSVTLKGERREEKETDDRDHGRAADSQPAPPQSLRTIHRCFHAGTSTPGRLHEFLHPGGHLFGRRRWSICQPPSSVQGTPPTESRFHTFDEVPVGSVRCRIGR